MIDINPMRIPGRWKQGYALDHHTLSSTYVGDDEYGHPQYETNRSALGELLYRLKYRSEAKVVEEIVAAVANFMERWKPGVEVIVPVPPSRPRRGDQPVLLLAQGLSDRLGIPLGEYVRKAKQTPELKDVFEYNKRSELLADAFEVDAQQTSGKTILLFDDLYRSGATLSTIASVLYDAGQVKDVYALVLTRTRSNR